MIEYIFFFFFFSFVLFWILLLFANLWKKETIKLSESIIVAVSGTLGNTVGKVVCGHFK